MKKLFALLLTTLTITVKGQQFSFQMNFVDAVGNRDSLILGYDTNGTDTIDAAFGETNIISTPLDSVFDVRVTNEQYNRQYGFTAGTYHTKKQIVTNHCSLFGISIIAIDIFSKHFPITATWNSNLFNDTCRNGSLFTSFNPGGWWDVGAISDLGRVILKDVSQVTFTSQVIGIPYEWYAYINNSNDTISTFWLTMYDSTIILSSVGNISTGNQPIIVFPNPADGNINLQFPLQFGQPKEIEVYSPVGQHILSTNTFIEISVESLNRGVYFIVATNSRGEKLTTRFLKL